MIKLKQQEQTQKQSLAPGTQVNYPLQSQFSIQQLNTRESEIPQQPEFKQLQTLTTSNFIQNQVQKLPFSLTSAAKTKIQVYYLNDQPVMKRTTGKSEVNFLSVLEHPHIVQLIKLLNNTQNSNQIDILLNYMPENLKSFLNNQKTQGGLLQNLIIKIYAYQLIRAALYLEKLNIVHNDLNPDNILINNQELLLQVSDFSKSFMFDKKNNPLQKAIHHQLNVYSAPEILLGRDFYGCPADMWSIGCILSEMILLEPVFEGGDATEIFLDIVKMLGTPTNEDIIDMVPKKSINSLPKLRRQPLIKFFKYRYPDPKLIDLISQIFVYSPLQRITPLQALLHPYFDQLREKNFQLIDRTVPDFFNFLEQELIESTQEEVDYLIPKWVYDRVSDVGSEISPEKIEQMDFSDYIAVQSYFRDEEISQELINMKAK